jgi:hypothetical protein
MESPGEEEGKRTRVRIDCQFNVTAYEKAPQLRTVGKWQKKRARFLDHAPF